MGAPDNDVLHFKGSVLVTLQNEQVTLLPADTIGRKEYAQDRVLAYAGAGVVLLCYDVMERKSFENITKKWMAEVELCAPTIPIILVGTKVEQRLVRERPRSQCKCVHRHVYIL